MMFTKACPGLAILTVLIQLAVTGSAQRTLVPFREGTLWGLSDVTGRLVLTPQYDAIEVMGEGGAFKTFKNGKKGAVYNGAEILPPVFSSLNALDKRLLVHYYRLEGIPPAGGSRAIVYNLAGKNIFRDTVDEIKAVPMELVKGEPIYVIQGLSRNSRVVTYDIKAQRVKEILLKGQPGYLEFAHSVKERKIFIYRYSKSGNAKYVISYNQAGKKYEVEKSPVPLEDALVSPYDGMSGDIYQVKNKFMNQITEFVGSGNELMRVIKYQREGSAKEVSDTTVLTMKYDEVHIRKYRQYDGYEFSQYTTAPNNESDKETIDTLFAYRNYLLYRASGKWGLVAERTLIGARFDTIKAFRASSTLKPYFLVGSRDAQQQMKYGVLRADGKTLLPVRYDGIDFNERGGYGVLWVLRNAGRYGFAMNDGRVIREPVYDSVVPNQLYYSLNIIDGGRFGYYDINGNFCQPSLPYRIHYVIKFNGEKFLTLIDDREKLIGYAHFNGTLYFR